MAFRRSRVRSASAPPIKSSTFAFSDFIGQAYCPLLGSPSETGILCSFASSVGSGALFWVELRIGLVAYLMDIWSVCEASCGATRPGCAVMR